MKTIIPNIVLPIIKIGISSKTNIANEFDNKKIVLFGIPGAFTPTCSEKHFPGYIKLFKQFKNKKIDEIYCLSVNDPYVMISWLQSYSENNYINGIADGNAELTKYLHLTSDKSKNFMGIRSNRFAMIVKGNKILKCFVEKPGELNVSSAENILKEI